MKIKNANIWTKEHGFIPGGISFGDTIEQVGAVSGADAIDAAIRKIEGADLGEWVKVSEGAQYLVTVENVKDYYSE